jgi:uncharacterized membrane protein
MDMTLILMISITLATIVYILFIVFFYSYRKKFSFKNNKTDLKDDMNILITELTKEEEEYKHKIEEKIKTMEKKIEELEKLVKNG